MPTWGTRGLRGSSLEDMINYTNEKYRESKIALIQKIPTPIKPIRIDKENRHITLAYFEQKSTVDYIGTVQGIPVCFDAKECRTSTFPIQNIHEHQVKFMEEFEEQGGVSFLIIYYTSMDEFVYMPFTDVKRFFMRAKNGGRKSITIEEVDMDYKIRSGGGVLVHYLEALNKDLSTRMEEENE